METDQHLEQEIATLERQLDEARAAENFFETASGKLIIELINRRVTLATRKVTSTAYEKDHMGYVNELAWLRANQQLLRELQVAKAPARIHKLKEKLTDYGQ